MNDIDCIAAAVNIQACYPTYSTNSTCGSSLSTSALQQSAVALLRQTAEAAAKPMRRPP